MASSSNAVARLVLAYKGKLHSKVSCCWNMRDRGGPLLLWCRQRGVKTCHSLVTVMSVSNEHQSCFPPLDEGKEHA